MKKNITLTLLFTGQISYAANGFLADSNSVVHLGGIDSSSSAWLPTQMTWPDVTTWGDDFQSVSYDVLMLRGNGGAQLTRTNRNTSIVAASDTFDIGFAATGGFETDPLGLRMGTPGITGTSISFFRKEIVVSAGVSELTITNTYDVALSPFSGLVWEGAGNLGTNATATLSLYDENLQLLDLSNANWTTSSGTPLISTDGFTATSLNSSDLRITNLGDGDISDDFIGRVEITYTPTSGAFFGEGAFFSHTTNGQTFANSPIVVPEPSQSILALLGVFVGLLCDVQEDTKKKLCINNTNEYIFIKIN